MNLCVVLTFEQLEMRYYLTTAVRILCGCDIDAPSSLLLFDAHVALRPFAASEESWRSFDVKFYHSILLAALAAASAAATAANFEL